MTKIYLIRHAEAQGNVFRRLQGQYDAQVTPNGRKQIAALQQRFADIPVDAVYASDLTRTCQTAEAIYKPKGLPLNKEPRLRELSVGIWENQPFGWLRRTDPERNLIFSHQPSAWSVEGSETFPIYTARFMEALNEIAQRHEGQTVALFSHGMVLRGVLQLLFFPEDEHAVAHCENTAVTLLCYENGKYSLEMLNDASHIPHEISTLARQQWWRGSQYMDFNMWYRDAEAEDADFLRELGCPEGLVRVAMLDEERAGAIVMQEGKLQHFAIHPNFRGRGLSPQLLGEAIYQARKYGCAELRTGQEAEGLARHVLEKYDIV